MKYTKEEAIKVANDFITEVNKLEKKYNITFNSDTGDVYFTFKTKVNFCQYHLVWNTISLGWSGDGSGIKVIEESYNNEKLKEQAISKLSKEEREALGLT